MFNSKAKDEALAIHGRAVDKYNMTLKDVQIKCERLYVARRQSADKIEEIETLINSIANTPKEIDRSVAQIKTERFKFRDTESYAAEASESTIKSGIGMAAGIAGGAAVAGIAPTAAMWVATTFGTASTGTAISTLSGAAATKAALAWLGHGALAAGGAGMAGGQALLALAGPIGWGISGAAAVSSAVALRNKNKKIADQAIEEAKVITFAGAKLRDTGATVTHLRDETVLLFDRIKTQLIGLANLAGSAYQDMSNDEQLGLGALVNNTLSLAEMLNKTV